MECSTVHFSDLPPEVLLMILKKFEIVEILYSFLGINMELDQLICDPSIISTEITLIEPLPGRIFDRFCSQILPKVSERIQWLNLETSSMERILLASTNYLNLHRLDLFLMNIETDIHLFTSELFLRQKDKCMNKLYLDKSLMNIFRNQIVTMNINGKQDIESNSSKINRLAQIFLNGLIACEKLRYLTFYTSVPIGSGYHVSFNTQSPMFFSSTLVELHINIDNFDDCLFLLDGCFDQLRLFFVTTLFICPVKRILLNEVSRLSIR